MKKSSGGWNYRLCKYRFHYKLGKKAKSVTVFEMRSAYYDKKGKLNSWADRGHPVSAESKEEVIWMLERMLANAKGKPVVWIGHEKRRTDE